MTNRSLDTIRLWCGRAPWVLTVCLLGGVAVDKSLFHVPPADAAPYHSRVRSAAARVPYHVGSWLGTDTPVPPSAVALLRPNVILARSYQNVRTGNTATFLLVQCGDARDLLGHYPPVCYVTHGWLKGDVAEKDWHVADLVIPATRYTFTSKRFDRPAELHIDNFMVLPDGAFCRDMDGVQFAAQDYRRKFFGAAQVQLVFTQSISPGEREEFCEQMIAAVRPLLDEIRRGVTQ